MNKIDWTSEANAGYHRLEFPDGVVWPGKSNVKERVVLYRFPDDLIGKRVLDVGSWDGGFAFESIRRGARSAVAMDCIAWQSEFAYTRFMDARQRFGYEDRVEPVRLNIMDLKPDSFGTFDVVLFLQVLYHLHSPFHALANLRKVCTGTMIMETMALDEPESCLRFYGTHRVNEHGHPTNYPFMWASIICIEEMFRDAGFAKWEKVWVSDALHDWPGTQRRIAWHVWI